MSEHPDYLGARDLPYLLALMSEYDDKHAHRASCSLLCSLLIDGSGVWFTDEDGRISEMFDTFVDVTNWLLKKL